MADDQKKPPSAKQAILNICSIVGIAAAMGVMFGLGFSGALPGAAFGALGGLVGWLTGRLIVLVALKE